MTSSAVRRGARSGIGLVTILLLSGVPARLSGALRGFGSPVTRLERVVAGTVLDLSAVILFFTPVIVGLTVLTWLVVGRARSSWWQRFGPLVWGAPGALAVWVLTVTAQEVKRERGSFPTMFDLLEGGTNSSFLEGALGFIRYERIWLPGAIGLGLMLIAMVGLWRRSGHEVVAFGGWATGLVLGGVGGSALVLALAASMGMLTNRYSSAALGDPLTGLVESTFDLLRKRGPATPRELVMDIELPADATVTGARLLGWPSEGAHHRPLDWTQEPWRGEARGRKVLDALGRLSAELTAAAPLNVVVLSLEGFRADDLHALNPEAPSVLAPFINGLYDSPRPGVMASRRMVQAGVRTAHGLGAMSCGLGTLPYNLAFIRDLQPFPVRCLNDVFHDAGFEQWFFYGSDGHFDEMNTYFTAHGVDHLLTQAELPKDLPTGTWDGVTDLALFTVAAQKLSEGTRPQMAWLMSLSNHSPFTPPRDLPEVVRARVDEALRVPNHADADDRLRLTTFAYTDFAVQAFFEALDRSGLAARTVVLVLADHSTGHSYVWGAPKPESDEAKAQIPFVLVVPAPEGSEAVRAVQHELDRGVLSQNDVPSMLLALMSSQLGSLPPQSRWHTLGGQVTSPWFEVEPQVAVMGINGVSEHFVMSEQGARLGGYQDSVFLKTRIDRYRVTPRLIPISAVLQEVLRGAPTVTTPAHE